MKVCKACGKEKPLSQFHRQKRGAQGVRSTCKVCRLGENAGKQLRTRAEEFARNLQRQYSMTVEEYEALFEAQVGRCAICQKVFDDTWQGRPRVDHDHETNKVRGLLCNKCNMGLGLLGDSQASLKRALNYLEVA